MTSDNVLLANGNRNTNDPVETARILSFPLPSPSLGRRDSWRNFDDPRRIPYLLAWKDERDGEIKEVVRLTSYIDQHLGTTVHHIELKRTNGSKTILRLLWRKLPRNGGDALFLLCPHCQRARRFICGWEWNGDSGWSNVVRSISWRCRSCARLRYSSEGGYLRGSGRGAVAALFRSFGNLPRPQSWLPYVFTSLEEAAKAGVCELLECC